APLLHGQIKVERIALVGVQLTLIHGKDGLIRLGINGAQNQSDVLQRIRDAVSHSGQGMASLNGFAVMRARLAFFEEQTGAFIVSPNANLQITKDSEPGNGLSTKADVDAQIEISGKPARLVAEVQFPASGDTVSGDVSITGLVLSALASNSPFFAFLAPFDLRADITGNFQLAHNSELRTADFGIGAAGTLNGLGKPLHVRKLSIAGRYDGATGRLLIDDASLEGVQARAHMTGMGDLGFDAKGALDRAMLSLQLDKFAMNMPDVMDKSVAVAKADVHVSYLPSSNTISIDQAFVYGGALSANFAGRLRLAQGRSPAIDLDGTIAQLDVRDLLHFWPLQVADGARRWLGANVPAGRIGPVLVHTHIPQAALEEPALPDSALSVTFPIAGASINYIRGLTPLSAVSGTGTLSGDTFKADIDSAAAGNLSVSQGHVVIPVLHRHGTVGQIAAHVDGTVQQVLALIDQKPLNYPSRFHIRSESAKGTAAIDLSVHVPMLHDIKMKDVGLSIRAATSNFGIALSDRLAISNGNLVFNIDNKALRAAGTAALADSIMGVDWTEAFEPQGPISTRLKLSGTLGPEALAALGIDASDYISGPFAVAGELDGYRGKIERAQLKVDLSAPSVTVKLLGFKKPAALPAQAQVTLRMDAQSHVRNADVILNGVGLSARGSARFGPAENLQYLDIPSFKSGTNNDFALNLTRDPVQGVNVLLSGHSIDQEGQLEQDTKEHTPSPPAAEKTEASSETYHLTVRLDRLVLREGVTLAPFTLNVSGAGSRPKTLALSGMLSKTAQVTGGMSSQSDGQHIRLTAGDAGLLFKGLSGSASFKGGTLAVDALMANASAKSDPLSAEYSGTCSISDVTVLNQPFLMKLFSAGSFDGLAALMGAKGIQLDKVELPFALHGDVLTVREARASATALGLTADGYYDLESDKLALQGTFTPFYGINGIVSSVPLLGNLLGSKKGEGFIGVTYSARGPADDPNVSVNPLSVLTPGIIRRIFQGNPPAPAAQAITPAQLPPQPQRKLQ
ncbi:MAG TPA: AsmA-like C-terminal domain-containing protein, partial [Rhizomicrobium sp.]|nr:AsmA-like C-terminal domain-containing protein [Rhizomicrobium sp.]